MPASLDDDVIRDGDALSSRPFRNAGRTGRQLSLCGTPEKSTYRQMSLSERSSIRVEEIIPAARVAIQVLRSLQRWTLNKSSARSEPGWSVMVLRFFSRPWKWVTSLLLWPVSCGSPGQLPQDGWIWWAARSQSKRPTAPFCRRGSAPESAAQVTQTLHHGCCS